MTAADSPVEVPVESAAELVEALREPLHLAVQIAKRLSNIRDDVETHAKCRHEKHTELTLGDVGVLMGSLRDVAEALLEFDGRCGREGEDRVGRWDRLAHQVEASLSSVGAAPKVRQPGTPVPGSPFGGDRE